jgi:hypothetical protein
MLFIFYNFNNNIIQVDYCFTIVSYEGIVYYVIFR